MSTPRAQTERVAAEYQVKAAYLYKFLDFVEWPPQAFESAQSPFVIGVIGADALADELALVVANQQAGGRPAVARKLRPGEPVTGVHMLFIGRSAAARAAGLVASTKDTPVLTETEDAFAAGSSINFVLIDNKVRFHAIDPALRITFSAGIAVCQPGETLAAAIERADQAMYAAKQGGRDRSVVAEPLTAPPEKRVASRLQAVPS